MLEKPEGLQGLDTIFAEARRTWPELELPIAELKDDLEGRRVDYKALSPGLAMDVYLASACLHDLPQGLRIFRERYAPVIAGVARRFDPSPSFADDVFQHLHEVLFVAPVGKEPKISQYTGEGALSAFVATAAHRIAMRLSGNARRYQGDAALVDKLLSVEDQETLFLKAHYLEALNRHLLVAVQQLDRRGRMLLRLNLVERVSTTKLAAMYNVNQSTISRRIHQALRDIFAAVKKQACQELGLDTTGFTSALELVRSQLDLRLSQTNDSIDD